MNEVGFSDKRDVEGASPPPEDTVALIRRYMQIVTGSLSDIFWQMRDPVTGELGVQ